VKYCDAFKYLGVILDSSLSMNQHVDHVKKNVSKMLGIFSRARRSLTIESANKLFKSMILPILDYCVAVISKDVVKEAKKVWNAYKDELYVRTTTAT